MQNGARYKHVLKSNIDENVITKCNLKLCVKRSLIGVKY